MDAAAGPSLLALGREATCRLIVEATEALNAGRPTAANLASLRAFARGDDPLPRKMARAALQKWTPKAGPLELQTQRWGPVDGAVQRLENLAQSLRCGDVAAVHPWHDVEPALRTLDEALQGAAPDERALRTLTDVARLLDLVAPQLEEAAKKRADLRNKAAHMSAGERKKLESKHRRLLEQEPLPADSARRWADACRQQVDAWWRQGRVRVPHDVPDGFSLARELSKKQHPAIAYGVVDLRAAVDAIPATPAAVATAADLLDATQKDLATLPDRLKALASQGDAAVSAVLGAVVKRLDPRHSLDAISFSVGAILEQAAANPVLKAALTPLCDLLFHAASEAARHGTLGEGGSVAHLYSRLVEIYPERVDEAFVRREIQALLASPQSVTSAVLGLVTQVWKAHPELVGPTLDGPLDAAHPFDPHDGRWQLVEKAAEQGWTPSERQVDWLMAAAWSPPSPSLFGYTTTRRALMVLSALEQQHPGATNGARLTDRQGSLVSPGSALLERAMSDAKADEELLSNLYAPSDLFGVSRMVYQFLPVTAADQLLAQVEAATAGGADVESLPREDKAALAVLASLELTDTQRGRLQRATRMQDVLDRVAGNPNGAGRLSGILAHACRHDLFDAIVQRLESRPLARAQRIADLELGAKLLRTRLPVPDSQWNPDTLGARLIGAARDGLEHQSRLAPISTDADTDVRWYSQLMPGDADDERLRPNWELLRSVYVSLGGESARDAAYEIAQYVLRQEARGVDREEALAHALACRAFGGNPDDVPLPVQAGAAPRVEREGGRLRIGGVEVPVRA